MKASDTPRPILELQDVVSGYGSLTILKGISLCVHAGEIVTLIGSNGAGKTTMLNTICGIVPVREGHIFFMNEEISRRPTHDIARLGIAHVPEGRRLFPDLTVVENLQMGAFLRKDRDEIERDIERMFAVFPRLRERAHMRAGSLSGGEQQMCAIARGLMARPKILLLDEPSLGLAPKVVAQIFEIIQQINNDGIPVLLVEQNAHLALSLAHRGYVIATGTITLQGTGQELLGNELVKKHYLGEA